MYYQLGVFRKENYKMALVLKIQNGGSNMADETSEN